MYKVLAIIGSPRKGDTYKDVQDFERELKKKGDIQFDYLFLKDVHLEQCVGCFMCLGDGEERCPRKDDRDKIFNTMKAADGIIFATPVYALAVPAVMKNFFDRFSFVFHRPCFFHKVAMGFVTQGAYGAGGVQKFLKELSEFWGFIVCPGVSINSVNKEQFTAEQLKYQKKIAKAASRFYCYLTGHKNPSPLLKYLVIFRAIRSMRPYIKEEAPKDYAYWESNGWLTKPYYYNVKLDLFQKIVGALADKHGTVQGRKFAASRKK
ncbi:MAG: flavodoxin family protein [bacterium]|nr:flavodoxin family protein [bacterium]